MCLMGFSVPDCHGSVHGPQQRGLRGSNQPDCQDGCNSDIQREDTQIKITRSKIAKDKVTEGKIDEPTVDENCCSYH